jgi:hypothetical protein
MKMKCDMWQVASDKMKCKTCQARSCHPSPVTRHSQQGVALIITLILLAVVTIMAISFLAVSRRERNAVSTLTDTASARYAADAALAGAQAQIIANVLSTTNPYDFGLLVSTNYVNPLGFQPNVSSYTNVNYDHRYNVSTRLDEADFLQNLTNLLYSPRPPVFISTNTSGGNEFRYYLDLNRNGRYDTNGVMAVFSSNPSYPYFDTNGNVMANIIFGNTASNFMVGDPEWIGILERPDAPHGPNNKFIARYAYIAVPVGNTLDLNAIHNQVFDQPSSGSGPPVLVNPGANTTDGFFRNQGVGSWEINLAAFLVDLNTNIWAPTYLPQNSYYAYNQPVSDNQGSAFADARALLAWRYANNYYSLTNANALFVTVNPTRFANDGIDGYTDGALQASMNTNADFVVNDRAGLPWAGADNTNRFFTHQELFDLSKAAMGVQQIVINARNDFADRLLDAGTNISTYDRYTFYRLLSQLGTDSAPESDKININFDNLHQWIRAAPNGNITNAPSATNMWSWQTPLTFFTNAVDRLLRAYTAKWRADNPTNFIRTFYTINDLTTITNKDNWANYPAFGLNSAPGGPPGPPPGIPVLVSNQFVYSPAVNRLVQLAANIYDATVDNSFVQGRNYPSVFRPTFWVTNQNGYLSVYINSYQWIPIVNGSADPILAPPVDVTSLMYGLSVQNYPNGVNVYGVPWIIGAKRDATNGFPAFNKFSMQNVVAITRKVQIKRNKIPIQSVTDFDYTNQLYVFSVSNSLGINCWNSYSNASQIPVQIVVNDSLTMALTNDWKGAPPWGPVTYSITTNILLGGAWPGTAPWASDKPNPTSFQVPINTTIQFLTNSAFYFGGSGYSGFMPVGLNVGWETNKHDFTFPRFGLLTTNRLQMYMLEFNRGNYRVIDYVQFAGPESSRDLNAEIQTNISASGYANMWSTNLNKDGVPWGIVSQIRVSQGDPSLDPLYWSDSWASDAILGFNAFMTPNGATWYPNPTANYYASNYIVQVPYTPTVTTYEYISWQANDPLVHYLTSDLNFYGTEAGGSGPTTGTNVITSLKTKLPRPSFKALNERYQPWHVINQMAMYAALVDQNPNCLAYKDPLARRSDDWNFPTNDLSIIQRLGQIHRGTPWQTIYLKVTNILSWAQTTPPWRNGMNTWMYWTGDFDAEDATALAPVRDRHLAGLLACLLTTNDLTSLFSVNNPNPDSWQVLFDGLTALTNNLSDIMLRFGLIDPQFDTIVISSNSLQTSAIVNAIQTARISRPPQYFCEVDDILSIPQLSEQSPYLNWSSLVQQTNGITDEAYERIPSQLLPLLRADSIGAIAPVAGQVQVQFTGYDGHLYAVQVSADLVNWTNLSTNIPANGTFSLTISASAGAGAQFYRSAVLQ